MVRVRGAYINTCTLYTIYIYSYGRPASTRLYNTCWKQKRKKTKRIFTIHGVRVSITRTQCPYFFGLHSWWVYYITEPSIMSTTPPPLMVFIIIIIIINTPIVLRGTPENSENPRRRSRRHSYCEFRKRTVRWRRWRLPTERGLPGREYCFRRILWVGHDDRRPTTERRERNVKRHP